MSERGTARHGGPPGHGGPRLTLAVHAGQEQYAPGSGPDVGVFLQVAAQGMSGAAAGLAHAHSQVVIIDCSGSMAHPTFRKMGAARAAAAEAIGRLPDGVHFALIEGTGSARVIHPRGDPSAPATVAASPGTREAGRRAALAMNAYGGTRISAWLDLADRLLTARPDAAFRHALLLTDGRDEHDSAAELDRVLDRCAGRFTCDALGIGTDWDADQLRRIVTRLGGRAEHVELDGDGPDGARQRLSGVFRRVVGAATARALPRLTVRVRPAPHVHVTLFRQHHPALDDLTATAEHDGGTHAYPTGAWGDGERWYELRLRPDTGYPAPGPGSSPPIAEVWLEADTGDVELPPPRRITVHWTDTSPPPTDLGGPSEHWHRYTELDRAAQDGSRALREGELDEAVRHLGRAVRLAHLLHDEEHLARLARLVVVEDPAEGRVRVRSAPEPQHIESVLLASNHTHPPVREHTGTSGATGPVTCGACAKRVRPGRFCERCGHLLAEAR
ncbi:VWA domain-containing protein [Streptomyces capparidis]